jgi:hypothetical protein
MAAQDLCRPAFMAAPESTPVFSVSPLDIIVKFDRDIKEVRGAFHALERL